MAQLAVGGLEQIIPFGRSTDGNTGEQVVAQISGSSWPEAGRIQLRAATRRGKPAARRYRMASR